MLNANKAHGQDSHQGGQIDLVRRIVNNLYPFLKI